MSTTTPSAPDEVVLAPCPFCGSPASLEHDNDHHGEWFNLGCSRHWDAVPDADDACPGGRLWYTEDPANEAAAIAAWNRRASPQPAGVTEEQPFDFISLAAHLAKVNAGREVIERESDGATFVHRDVCIEAMQALRLPSPTDTRERALEEAANLVAGWTVAMNSKHLLGWARTTIADQVHDMLVERDGEIVAAIRALKSKPTEAPVEDGWVRVPQSALDWLFGSGPDANGKWFDEVEEGFPTIKSLNDRRPPFWWRSHFRRLIPALAASTKEE